MSNRKLTVAMACGALLALGTVAQANVIEVSRNPTGAYPPQDVDFSASLGSENPVTVFGWLGGEILSYNNHVSNILPDASSGDTRYVAGSIPGSISVGANDYVTIHYGKGDGGQGQGGGEVAFFFTTAQTFVLPPMGSDIPSNIYGLGGISTVDIWDHTSNTTVPDGGMTVGLLGLGLLGLGAVARYQKRLA